MAPSCVCVSWELNPGISAYYFHFCPQNIPGTYRNCINWLTIQSSEWVSIWATKSISIMHNNINNWRFIWKWCCAAQIAQLPRQKHLHTNDASKCFSSIYSYGCTYVPCPLCLSPSPTFITVGISHGRHFYRSHGTVEPTIWRGKIFTKNSIFRCEKFELSAFKHAAVLWQSQK